jgi:hypothetical protein
MDRDVWLCELIVISTKCMICEPLHSNLAHNRKGKQLVTRLLDNVSPYRDVRKAVNFKQNELEFVAWEDTGRARRRPDLTK